MKVEKVTIEKGMEIVVGDEDNREVLSGHVIDIRKDDIDRYYVLLSDGDFLWIKPKK